MPKWTQEQMKAIEKDGSNIIVSAGAGSGKTAVLTERVIKKLNEGIKINELLILTFTNAAAGEMKERIRKKILEHPSILDNLNYLDSAYITTFDSFTLSLVKKYNYILNVSSNLSIIDSGIISIKKEEILDRVFDELYEENNSLFINLLNVFTIKNDNNLKSSILKIINSMELISDKENYLNNYIDNYLSIQKQQEYINEYLNLIYEEINIIETNLIYISETEFNDYYESMVNVLDKLIKSRSYDEIKINMPSFLPRRPRDSIELLPYKENIDNALKSLKEYLRFDSINEIEEIFSSIIEYVRIIIEIIKRFNKKLDKYKIEHDLYEFTDIELMAIKLLKDNDYIREEMKYYYKEICVDEYQDTNDLQEEFINLIENNNVYMVGDIKQSIYGFRNANPSIFKEKYDKYSNNFGGIKIDLLKNFRSREEVLKGINEIFSCIMDNEVGGADYKSTHQMIFGNTLYTENKDNNQNYDLEIYNYNYDNKLFSKEEIEAFIIGRDILKKINDGYTVIDKNTFKLRTSKYEDYCIIMDRGTSFPIYKKIFEYLGIPLTIYEDKKLTSEIDIMLINNILGLILKIKNNLKDKEFKYYFMSIARSFLFEYDDNKIFTIIKDNLYEKSDIYGICNNIVNSINLLNNYEVIERIINDFNFYENSIKVGNIDDTIIRINNLLDIAKNLSNIGYTIEEYKDYISKMIDSKNEIVYKEVFTNTNSVKIINIHKSKGLEFPICYFSGFHKEFNTMDIKERFTYDNRYGIITPYFDEGIGSTILKDLLKNKYTLDNISERIRLLYVALTRAKEKMIIVTSLNEERNYTSKVVDINIRKKYNSFLSIINSISGNLNKYIININLDNIGITKDYMFNNEKNKIDDNTNTDIITYKEINIDNEIIKNKHASKIINKLIDKNEYEKLEYGTYVHKLFEMEDFLNSDNILIKNLVNKFKIKKNSLIYKEHEFIYEKEGISYHGIIDLILIDNDVIKLIDYKLKNISDEKYKEQLKVYYDYIDIVLNKYNDKKIEVYLYSIIDNNCEIIEGFD